MFYLGGLASLALLSVYIYIIRPLLKQQPALSAAFKAEASFWDQLQAKITGWRTRIASRLVVIAGMLVGIYDQALPLISGQDWTPVTSKLPQWALPVGLVGAGLVFEWLRKITENPPQVIVQADAETGEKKVIAIVKPAS
jgi:hypothetical protein